MVTRIAVAEGSKVQAGALLLVLTSDKLRTGGGTQHAALTQWFDEERGALAREVQAARQEAVAGQAVVARKLAGLRVERQMLAGDLRVAEELLASFTSQTEQVASIAAEGYFPQLQLARKRDEVTAQQGRVLAARAALARVDREVATTEVEGQQLNARLAGMVENRRRASSELGRLLAQSESDAEQVIRASVDGTVSTALIAQGQSVAAGQALLTLAPAGQPWVARLLVPARVVASIKPGSEVRLAFRAYPREKFGEVPARIESVAAHPVMPGDPTSATGTGEPVFLAVATLPQHPRLAGGQTLDLKAGLVADAIVPLERRTVLEWLLAPFLRAFDESASGASQVTTLATKAR